MFKEEGDPERRAKKASLERPQEDAAKDAAVSMVTASALSDCQLGLRIAAIGKELTLLSENLRQVKISDLVASTLSPSSA